MVLTIVTLGLYPVFLLLRIVVRSIPFGGSSRKDGVRHVATAGSSPNELVDPACPYCGVVQDPPPKRKKKCADCGQSIYVRKDGNRRRLMTETQVRDLENKQREEHWKNLSRQVENALRTSDWNAASQAYRGQAEVLFSEGRKHLHVREEADRCQLRSLQELGIGRVQVSTCGDERVCPYCESLNGKVLSVAQALESMPLPSKKCTDGSDVNPYGGRCRCIYLSVVS